MPPWGFLWDRGHAASRRESKLTAPNQADLHFHRQEKRQAGSRQCAAGQPLVLHANRPKMLLVCVQRQILHNIRHTPKKCWQVDGKNQRVHPERLQP